MDSTELNAAKQSLRDRQLAQRKARGPVAEAISLSAESRLLESELLASAACVALYRALPSEISTTELAEQLSARGVQVVYPVVQADGPLEFHRAERGFARASLGIDEPHGVDKASLCPLDAIDAFLIPALAADLQGNRLGRGRAHYDRTLLAHPRAKRIALLCEWALVPAVPVGEHDAPLDALCTEARLILCPARS
jgi:5-formyltetrahydrofolate cyclo-ligase